MPSETARAIVKIASTQHEVVTTRQLVGVGFTLKDIEREIRRGVIERFGRGAYRLAGAQEGWQQLLARATLLRAPDAAASHTTAARIWELKVPTRPFVEIAVPYRCHSGSSDPRLRVHMSRTFSQAVRTRKDGFPVTTPARTFLDLAPVVGPRILTAALDDAVGRRIVRPSIIRKALPEPGSRNYPGLSALHAALDLYNDVPLLDSVAETNFLRLLAEERIPRPVCHYEIHDEGGAFLAEVDFAWPSKLVAVEMDGYQFHVSPQSHAHDLARISEISALGWFVLCTSPTVVATNPRSVLASLRRRVA